MNTRTIVGAGGVTPVDADVVGHDAQATVRVLTFIGDLGLRRATR